jgi:Flp pilus assembly protein TadB
MRRAQREAAQAVAAAKRERGQRRRARRRALVRRLTPRPLTAQRRRRAWLLGRRSPGQRAVIIGVAIALLWAVWYFVQPWPLRIAFSIVALALLPLLVVVTFNRRV